MILWSLYDGASRHNNWVRDRVMVARTKGSGQQRKPIYPIKENLSSVYEATGTSAMKLRKNFGGK